MMTERRPATTIGELDIHLGFIMEKLNSIESRQAEMMTILATKSEVEEQIKALNKRIDEESYGAFMDKIQRVAKWVAVVAAGVGVVVAIAKSLKFAD